MRIVVDTCVVSDLKAARPEPRVQKAIAAFNPTQLFLSAVTIGELTKGVHLLPQGARRKSIDAWVTQVERDFSQRVLPIDDEVARIWGEITARAAQLGRVIPVVDGLIAATALRHGMHLMTRNTADFVATGVSLIDPWQ